MKYLLVLPTLNEVENAPKLILQVLESIDNLDILVVDDGSTDGTVEKIKSSSRVYFNNQIKILKRESKLGLAKAYIDGFNWGINEEYDAVISMDSDGSHRLSDLMAMISEFTKSESVDLMIGSRWINGGSVKNWSFKRVLLSRCANLIVNTILIKNIKDATSGFRISRVSALKSIPLVDFESTGFIFQVELTMHFKRKNYSIIEFPIQFEQRFAGKSKLDSKIIVEALLKILKWSTPRIIQNKLKTKGYF